jgi:mono/diheme cytochrome c family protein
MGRSRRRLSALAAVVIALAAVTAVVWAGDGGGSPAATPVAASAPAPTLDGADVFQAKGCATCHMGPGTENSFGIGPNLVALPNTAGSRIPGMGAEEYVRESILDPGAFMAVAPAQGGGPYGTMPRLEVSPAELDALVLYLLRT